MNECFCVSLCLFVLIDIYLFCPSISSGRALHSARGGSGRHHVSPASGGAAPVPSHRGEVLIFDATRGSVWPSSGVVCKTIPWSWLIRPQLIEDPLHVGRLGYWCLNTPEMYNSLSVFMDFFIRRFWPLWSLHRFLWMKRMREKSQTFSFFNLKIVVNPQLYL